MSNFWRGLVLGGAVGAVMVLWLNRQQRPRSFKDRLWESASRTATRAQQNVGGVFESSRRRDSELMPGRK